jgi:hypothetical protein
MLRMLLFPLLRALEPSLEPKCTKIHLAGFNQREQPLDVYREGVEKWESWQAEQNKRNFERRYVVSLIDLPQQPELWLFVGVYVQQGRQERLGADGARWWVYDLQRLTVFDDIAGKLVVRHRRSDRASYRDAETIEGVLHVHELHARTLTLPFFPGYKQVRVSFSELRALVTASEQSWRIALSAVSGVYVLADSNDGKLYVGSAYGQGGIWGRWSEYAATGHGGNKLLRELVGREKAERAETFSFAILETADTSASEYDIRARESHWKEVLLSRTYGNNAN